MEGTRMNFLVVGLESSCTRYVSILLARNLGLPDWNGYEEIGGAGVSVTHRSLPHGSRDNFLSVGYCKGFDIVVVCTRDLNCSLESKILWHQPDRDLAIQEQERGRVIMAKILSVHPRVEIYSYESAFALGGNYNEMFFKRIGLPYVHHIETKEINSKYFRS